MSQITIQCRLVASEPARQQLWQLMAESNTPLINELLQQVGQHPDFEQWRHKGKLPAAVVSQLCQPLKTDSRFALQPSRFLTSAIHVVEYIYKSWLAVQKRLQQRLEGKRGRSQDRRHPQPLRHQLLAQKWLLPEQQRGRPRGIYQTSSPNRNPDSAPHRTTR